MTPKRISTLSLSLLLLSFCILLPSCGDADQKADPSPSDSAAAPPHDTASVADTSAKDDVGEYEIITDTIAEKNEKLRYEINAAYPQIRGLKNREVEEKFNREVRDGVAAMIRDFKASLIPPEEMPDVEGMEASFSSFYLHTTVQNKTGRTLSIELGNETYSAGAAHPNTASRAINYDLQEGRDVTLADLFLPNTDYLKFIADYCMRELQEKNISDKEWIEQGAGPKEENYSTFFITPKALVIHFDPYLVASYAAGPQEVEIGWEKMKGMIVDSR